MNRPGSAALEEELTRGQLSLDGLAAVLGEVQELSGQAGRSAEILSQVKALGTRAFSAPDQTGLRRAFRRETGGLRRGLKRRIAWLSLRVFWRRIRFWLLIALMLAGIAFAAGWAVKNRDWLVEQLAEMMRGSAPAPAQGSGSAAPAMPSPGPDAQAGGTP